MHHIVSTSSTAPRAAEPVVFCGLLALARLHAGGRSGEICEACHTINLAGALRCHGCAGRLQAPRVAEGPAASRPQASRPGTAARLELAAFWVVVNSLTLILAALPVP